MEIAMRNIILISLFSILLFGCKSSNNDSNVVFQMNSPPTRNDMLTFLANNNMLMNRQDVGTLLRYCPMKGFEYEHNGNKHNITKGELRSALSSFWKSVDRNTYTFVMGLNNFSIEYGMLKIDVTILEHWQRNGAIHTKTMKTTYWLKKDSEMLFIKRQKVNSLIIN